jgi:uncharacterized protein YlaN (UPF0358 family)
MELRNLRLAICPISYNMVLITQVLGLVNNANLMKMW